MRLNLFLAALLAAFVCDPLALELLQNAPDGVAIAGGLITWIGGTGWQALTLLTIIAATVFARPNPETAARADRIMRLAIACFLLILITGIAVQILKHIFGRPRPMVLGDLSAFTFAPVSFLPGWNAFPSGHSTTMGALAIFVARIWPKTTSYAWGVAILVAISRVLVGKHYPSDLVAGLALGAVLAIWMVRRWDRTGLLVGEGSKLGIAAGLKAIFQLARGLTLALVVRP